MGELRGAHCHKLGCCQQSSGSTPVSTILSTLPGERDALCQPGGPPGEPEPRLARHPDPNKALPAGGAGGLGASGSRRKRRISLAAGSPGFGGQA